MAVDSLQTRLVEDRVIALLRNNNGGIASFTEVLRAIALPGTQGVMFMAKLVNSKVIEQLPPSPDSLERRYKLGTKVPDRIPASLVTADQLDVVVRLVRGFDREWTSQEAILQRYPWAEDALPILVEQGRLEKMESLAVNFYGLAATPVSGAQPSAIQ